MLQRSATPGLQVSLRSPAAALRPTGRQGSRLRRTAVVQAAADLGSDSHEGRVPTGLAATLSALAAAGMVSLAVQTGVMTPPTALMIPPSQLAAAVAQAATTAAAVPFLGGTAVATTAAAVASSASVRQERSRQKVRLEALKQEVAALQVGGSALGRGMLCAP